MNEFELIHRLTRNLPTNAAVVTGPGDDCAVLDCGAPDRWLLFKTDAVVQDIHFTRDTPPEKVGRKALARCLSDVAAMAGVPTAAVVTLGLPRAFQLRPVEQIYAGMNRLARAHTVAIVGGETTTHPDRVLISVALVGWVEKNRVVRRSGARVGDALFVTGTLGGSLAGKHLDFEPRLAEARWLAEHFAVHAMIDLSDGLAGDLRHLLRASGVGAELLKTAIPISRAARERHRAGSGAEASGDSSPRPVEGKSPWLAALTDGEDFELLFTVPSKAAVPLLDAWRQQFPKLRLSCIGKITAGNTVIVRDKHGSQSLPEGGYAHFA
ncbi:MAG TPA: thiamine-phosphate kinase [Verrucomicrobiota bacterium]|nr:thiamine-phosphate kinase [Verrucomicrobiota bacterium]HQB15574.1 thiamine-phosphate kinase [Verrucomicrobiota bacterium]